jgi:hypothetical protein
MGVLSKKKMVLIVPVAVLVVLAVVASLLFGQQLFNKTYESNIATFRISTQQTGGVTSTNYMPVLAEGVSWEALNDSDREGTARYAVNAAIEQADKDSKQSFSVVGVPADSAGDMKPVFLYTSAEGKTINIFVGEELVQQLPLSG